MRSRKQDSSEIWAEIVDSANFVFFFARLVLCHTSRCFSYLRESTSCVPCYLHESTSVARSIIFFETHRLCELSFASCAQLCHAFSYARARSVRPVLFTREHVRPVCPAPALSPWSVASSSTLPHPLCGEGTRASSRSLTSNSPSAQERGPKILRGLGYRNCLNRPTKRSGSEGGRRRTAAWRTSSAAGCPSPTSETEKRKKCWGTSRPFNKNRSPSRTPPKKNQPR